MGSLGREGSIPKGWSWERSSSAHLPWATVEIPHSRDRGSKTGWGGHSNNIDGGQLLLCPEGMLVPALHLPGGPMNLLGELAAFIAARRVKHAFKAVSQKGETES